MSLTSHVDVSENHLTPGPSRRPTAGWKRNLAWSSGAIVAGWLVSGIAALARVDWILLPLSVLAVMSLLRTGRNALDRLILSTILLCGGLIAGGLLFSLWPWGLEPFPVAGSIFTVIAISAGVAGRRPRLPRGFALSDLVILGTAVFVFLAALHPISRLAYVDRFPFAYGAEDRAAHFSIFDTIHTLGSFPFLDQEAARIPLRTPTEADYPIGSHFLYVIVDIFVRSTTDPGPTIAEFQRYFVLVLAGYSFLLTLAVWAARWIISPIVRGWRVVAATATVSAVLVSGIFILLPWSGFDSQILGLAFLVVTAAIAVRPPKPLIERILLFGACIILVSYTYYLYLPLAVIAVVVSLAVDWKILIPSWRAIAVGAVVAGGIAVLPLCFAATSSMGIKAQSLAAGGVVNYPHSAVAAATIGSLLFLVVPNAFRYRRVRVISFLIPVWLAAIALFGIYQKVNLGKTSYYFDKLLACLLCVGIVCSATLVMFTKPFGRSARSPRIARLREFCASVLAIILAFTGVAGFDVGLRPRTVLGGRWKDSIPGAWYWNKIRAADRQEIRSLIEQGLIADGKPTLFLTTDTPYTNWRITFLDGALNRFNGPVKEPVDMVSGIQSAAVDPATGKRFDVEASQGHVDAQARQQAIQTEVDLLRKALSAAPVPMRVVVRDGDVAAALNRVLATNPQIHASVVLLPPN